MSAYTFSAGLLALVLVAACGGGGGGSTATPTAQGVFGNPPVAGLSYTSGTLTDVTDANGQFTYQVGQPVTFSLGGIQLPAVAGAALVTPFSVFGANGYGDPRAVNLIRLLQAVDADQSPDQGITIAQATRTAAAGVTLTDFASPTFDTDVAPVVAASRTASLPDPGTAASRSIVGTWVLGGTFAPDSEGGNGFQVLSLFPDGTYLHSFSPIEGVPAGPDLEPGLERGTYVRNPATEAARFTTVSDTNGDMGLGSSHGAPVTLHLGTGGDTLVITDPNGGTVTLKRLRTVPDSQVCGTWFTFRPADGRYVAIALLPTGEYMLLEDERQAAGGGTPGIEYGTYAWNAGAQTLTATPIVDSNGEWGFSHSTLATTGFSGATWTLGETSLTRLEP